MQIHPVFLHVSIIVLSSARRPKDSKWVPIHILFSSFSHLSCFLTDCEWGIQYAQFTYSSCMWKGAFCFFASGMCTLSPKVIVTGIWLFIISTFCEISKAVSLSRLIMQPVRGKTNHVTMPTGNWTSVLPSAKCIDHTQTLWAGHNITFSRYDYCVLKLLSKKF